MKTVTPDQMRAWIDYDPENGKLTWRYRDISFFKNEKSYKSFNTRFPGTPALASASGRGYLMGRIQEQTCMAHRAAWAIYHGVWPQGEIDHINGIRFDNRIQNLRDVSRSVNAKNVRRKPGASGIYGVIWDKKMKRWRVTIYNNGRCIHLGCAKDLEQARIMRIAAQEKYGYHANHGVAVPPR